MLARKRICLSCKEHISTNWLEQVPQSKSFWGRLVAFVKLGPLVALLLVNIKKKKVQTEDLKWVSKLLFNAKWKLPGNGFQQPFRNNKRKGMDCFNDCGYSNVQHVKTIKLQQLCTCIQLYRTYLEKWLLLFIQSQPWRKKDFLSNVVTMPIFVTVYVHSKYTHCIRSLLRLYKRSRRNRLNIQL